MDEALAYEASRTGTSKAALIREAVRNRIRPLEPQRDDPISAIIGAVECEPAKVDDIVYRD